MLLDPAKQQFDLPALFVECRDFDGGALKVVGEKRDLCALVAPDANAAHGNEKLGIAFADEPDLGIVDDGKAVALAFPERQPADGTKPRRSFLTRHEYGARLMNASPPLVFAVGFVEN